MNDTDVQAKKQIISLNFTKIIHGSIAPLLPSAPLELMITLSFVVLTITVRDI